ncbi:MAG: hypothetical protein LBP59_02325 [Planctomycetaceae bacterium]|jgi:hypothetical protein|nr:hypothetical protein [Planctomycetaceae bacterium]
MIHILPTFTGTQAIYEKNFNNTRKFHLQNYKKLQMTKSRKQQHESNPAKEIAEQDIKKIIDYESLVYSHIENLENFHLSFNEERIKNIKELKNELKELKDKCEEYHQKELEQIEAKSEFLTQIEMLKGQLFDRWFFTALSVIGAAFLSIAGAAMPIYDILNSNFSIKDVVQIGFTFAGIVSISIPIFYFVIETRNKKTKTNLIT